MNWFRGNRKAAFGGSVKRAGRGIKRERGKQNRLEREYEAVLRARLCAGEILWYRFEAVNLELAKKTFWRPDFFVLTKDCEIEIHEVKARWKKQTAPHIEDHAKVRIKVAAEQYPFRFLVCYLDAHGRWQQQEVNPSADNHTEKET